MKASFIVVTKEVAERACTAIRALPLDEPHEVVIRPKVKNRSASQHRLMWLWLTIIAGTSGHTKEEIHEIMKRRHLVNIYARDDSGYGEMIHNVKKLKAAGDKSAEVFARQITRLTSTTTASVEQFTEYLNDIEATALEYGCPDLPHPSDLYMEAMG